MRAVPAVSARANSMVVLDVSPEPGTTIASSSPGAPLAVRGGPGGIRLAVFFLPLLGLPVTEPAPPRGPETSEQAVAEEERATADDASGEPIQTLPPSEVAFARETLADPCAPPPLEKSAFIDRMQRGVFRSVCGTALWFDRLFGDDLVFAETDRTYGWVRALGEWDEQDGFGASGSLRAKFSFPRFERRVNAFFGRVSEEEFTQEVGREFTRLPQLFEDARDQEWLLGLGYTPVTGSRRRFSIGVGVDIEAPPDPFVRARYRRHRFFSDRSLGRWRQILFWRGKEGVGTSTIVDVERLLGRRLLLRWRTAGTVSESTDGIDWNSGLTLFQDLQGEQAVAYQLVFDGETEAPEPIWSYGLRATYRRRIAREWLYVEIRPGYFWRRRARDDHRSGVAVLEVGFELHFGEDPRRRARLEPPSPERESAGGPEGATPPP